jgi:hypothetical protein
LLETEEIWVQTEKIKQVDESIQTPVKEYDNFYSQTDH